MGCSHGDFTGFRPKLFTIRLRRGSRRNGDRFPNQRTPKGRDSRGWGGGGKSGACFLRNFFLVIHKNLTDFRKTVEAGMDPRLRLTTFT